MNNCIMVTGAAGFIGSNFVLEWSRQCGASVVSFDKLTYAGNLGNLAGLSGSPRHSFVKGDIADRERVRQVLVEYEPRAIVNFAAESHVDRSIYAPEEFIRTNVVGTMVLLDESLSYYRALDPACQPQFRFLHVSTDEVYGSLNPTDPPFSETTPYAPNSPYAASKASSDHLVRAYHHTYNLPTLTTNCSNNYGPFQFPEKLVPLMILNALAARPLPIYGDGRNVRDWLYVLDHCRALRLVLEEGRPGETYNIGGSSERTNIEVVQEICDTLDRRRPRPYGNSYRDLITFIKDRPGHDRRYAIDASKIGNELNWAPGESFSSGLRRTVDWYLANETWVQSVISGEYLNWIESHYSDTSEEKVRAF